MNPPFTPRGGMRGVALAGLLSCIAVLGLTAYAVHPPLSDVIDIGSVTTVDHPEGRLGSAPNGTFTVTGACTNSNLWEVTLNGSTNGSLGPPFTTGQELDCFITVNDSSLLHTAPDGAPYWVLPTSIEVAPPFDFVEELSFDESCPPGGCHNVGLSLEFRLPGQPGTYDAEFTVLYTWAYFNPP